VTSDATRSRAASCRRRRGLRPPVHQYLANQ
jgi:hypothetical protein